MSVRAFDWRDIPAIHRYRNQSIFLDSSLLLTRGELLLPGALFSYLAPSVSVFTCVAQEDSSPVIGQFIHLPGSHLARLTFLTPESALESPLVSALLEHFLALAGKRGALRLLADVDQHSQAFETLRRSGFAIYSRQRIWRMPRPGPQRSAAASDSSAWRPARSQDTLAIRLLYNNLVPGLVQQMEPLTAQRPHGMVYQRGGDLQAYIEFKYGHRGIWVQPFIHPDAEEVAGRLLGLLDRAPNLLSLPVYVCVRSYQSWLEPALEELNAQPGPLQAVMIKQLVISQKAPRSLALPALDGAQPEIPAPLAHIESFKR